MKITEEIYYYLEIGIDKLKGMDQFSKNFEKLTGGTEIS